eukprot:UN31982
MNEIRIKYMNLQKDIVQYRQKSEMLVEKVKAKNGQLGEMSDTNLNLESVLNEVQVKLNRTLELEKQCKGHVKKLEQDNNINQKKINTLEKQVQELINQKEKLQRSFDENNKGLFELDLVKKNKRR